MGGGFKGCSLKEDKAYLSSDACLGQWFWQYREALLTVCARPELPDMASIIDDCTCLVTKHTVLHLPVMFYTTENRLSDKLYLYTTVASLRPTL